MPLCIVEFNCLLGRNLSELSWFKLDKISCERGVSTKTQASSTTTATINEAASLQRDLAQVNFVNQTKYIVYIFSVFTTLKAENEVQLANSVLHTRFDETQSILVPNLNENVRRRARSLLGDNY